MHKYNYFDEFQKELGDKLGAEHATPWLERYEKFLTDNGTGYFVGKDVSFDLTYMANVWRSFIFTAQVQKQSFSRIV